MKLNRHSSSTLVDILESFVADAPGRPLYSFLSESGNFDTETWTYGNFSNHARAIAAHLQQCNMEGERALLLYPAGLEFVAAFLGCLYASVVAVPVYPPNVGRLNRTLGSLPATIADAQPAIALTTREIGDAISSFPDIGQVLPPDRLLITEELDERLGELWTRPRRLNGDTIAFLQYTSGSTGMPKGVIIDHNNLNANSERIRKAFQLTLGKDLGLGWLPLYHDMGLIGITLQPMFQGGSSILMSPFSFLKRPMRWLEAISHFRATVSGGPNFAYDLCVRRSTPAMRENLDLSSWALAFNGAEPIRPSTLSRFSDTFAECGFRRSSFYPCYGLAESTLLVSGGTRNEGYTVTTFDSEALGRRVAKPLSGDSGRPIIGAGRITPDNRVRIVDPDTLHPLTEGQIGEIWISGPSIGRGYWNKSELSEQVFAARLDDTGDQRYLRSGDLGFFHDGVLYIAGRIKDLIIIRGRNHYSQDIECTVAHSHPFISDGRVAAFGVEIAEGEQLVVAVETRGEAWRRRDELIETVRSAILRNHDVDLYGIVLLSAGAIPKTSSGKIRRSASRQAFQDGTWNAKTVLLSAANDVSPMISMAPKRDELMDWLVETLAIRLNRQAASIDIGRPFMDYGVDSATGIQLVGELEAQLGRQLPATLLYDQPTIESLVEYLSRTTEPASQGLDRTRAARRRAARDRLAETNGAKL